MHICTDPQCPIQGTTSATCSRCAYGQTFSTPQSIFRGTYRLTEADVRRIVREIVREEIAEAKRSLYGDIYPQQGPGITP